MKTVCMAQYKKLLNNLLGFLFFFSQSTFIVKFSQTGQPWAWGTRPPQGALGLGLM
jgi:hypothetical protein